MGMRTVLTGLAGMLLGSMMPVQADMPRPTGLAADIRWTAYGVPHIRAKDERGLGYGIGYAYARDNACLLAEEIVTARGERARYFGSEGKSSAELDNLPSDIFYAWLNQPEALQASGRRRRPRYASCSKATPPVSTASSARPTARPPVALASPGCGPSRPMTCCA